MLIEKKKGLWQHMNLKDTRVQVINWSHILSYANRVFVCKIKGGSFVKWERPLPFRSVRKKRRKVSRDVPRSGVQRIVCVRQSWRGPYFLRYNIVTTSVPRRDWIIVVCSVIRKVSNLRSKNFIRYSWIGFILFSKYTIV